MNLATCPRCGGHRIHESGTAGDPAAWVCLLCGRREWEMAMEPLRFLGTARDPTPLPRIDCERCGRRFQPRAVNQRWCSVSCRVRAVVGQTCQVCGAEFAGRRSAKYCGAACYREARREA